MLLTEPFGNVYSCVHISFIISYDISLHSIPVEHITVDLSMHDPLLAQYDWMQALESDATQLAGFKDWMLTESGRRGRSISLAEVWFKPRLGRRVRVLNVRRIGKGIETAPSDFFPSEILLVYTPLSLTL